MSFIPYFICPLSEIKTYTILASELLLANYSAESS